MTKMSRFIALILTFSMLVSAFAGCSSEKKEEAGRDSVFLTDTLQYSNSGKYTAKMVISEDDSFLDIENDDIKACSLDVEKDIEITVEKVDDKTINVSFDLNDNETNQIYITSDKEVTKNKKIIEGIIDIKGKENSLPKVKVDYSGAYRGSEALAGKITVNDGSSFVENITNDMLVVTSSVDDCKVELERVNDSQLDFRILNIPDYYNSLSIVVCLKGAAFKEKEAEDYDINIDYFSAYVRPKMDKVKYDENTGLVTIDIINLPNTADGEKNGISVVAGDTKIEKQEYDEKNKAYTNITFKVANKEALKDIVLGAKVSTNTDSFVCKFNPYDPLSDVEAVTNKEVAKTESNSAVPAIATRAASTIIGEMTGSKYAGVGVDVGLSLLFEFLGVGKDTSAQDAKKTLEDLSSDLATLKEEVGEMSKQLEDVSQQLADIEKEVGSIFDKTMLDNYSNLKLKLTVSSNTILSDPATIEYVDLLKDNMDESGKLKDKSIAYNEKFVKLVENEGKSSYIYDILLFGEKLFSTAAGTGSSVVDMYFNALDKIYNLESQTVEKKKNFLTDALDIYTLNSLIAIQYCDSVGNSNAALLRKQLEKVVEHINKYKKIVDSIEKLNKDGIDILLVTGQRVSRTLKVINSMDNYWVNFELFSGGKDSSLYRVIKKIHMGQINRDMKDTIVINDYDANRMVKRANLRNTSFALDVYKAGFKNIDLKDSNFAGFALSNKGATDFHFSFINQDEIQRVNMPVLIEYFNDKSKTEIIKEDSFGQLREPSRRSGYLVESYNLPVFFIQKA